jgi:hypothetical protein
MKPMKQPSEHRARSSTGRALATAALTLLCVTALSQPNPAYAHGGGGGGGGGGSHGGVVTFRILGPGWVASTDENRPFPKLPT